MEVKQTISQIKSLAKQQVIAGLQLGETNDQLKARIYSVPHVLQAFPTERSVGCFVSQTKFRVMNQDHTLKDRVRATVGSKSKFKKEQLKCNVIVWVWRICQEHLRRQLKLTVGMKSQCHLATTSASNHQPAQWQDSEHVLRQGHSTAMMRQVLSAHWLADVS